MHPTLEVFFIQVKLGWEYNGQFRYTVINLKMNDDGKLFYDCDDSEIIIPAFKDQLNKALEFYCGAHQKFDWVHFD